MLEDRDSDGRFEAARVFADKLLYANGLMPWKGGVIVTAAPHVAALVAPVLGWSEAQIAREIEHYLARVGAERLSQEQPDDQTADSARLGAPEIVPLT